METLLIEQWLAETDAVEILDEASLTLARDALRALPVPKDLIDRALLVASELGRNQLRHARRGCIGCRRVERSGRPGIEIIAADAGKGIDDIAAALDATARDAGSLGVGIGSVKRLATELDIDVRMGEGTALFVRIFAADTPKSREVGIYGRALPGESRSGDHAAFARLGETIHAVICDGLGHGHEARVASDRAIDVFRRHANDRPEALIDATHRGLTNTRGIVMAAAHIAADTMELASAGNIEAQLTSFRSTRRFGGTAATVGGRPGPLRARAEHAPFATDDVLVMMTDGIVTKASIENDAMLLRMHPAAIAQRVLERFARATDDALVLVVR